MLSAYILAAILEVLGIALTVAAHVKERDVGLLNAVSPEARRQRSRGLILIGAGVLIGLGGNIVELLAT